MSVRGTTLFTIPLPPNTSLYNISSVAGFARLSFLLSLGVLGTIAHLCRAGQIELGSVCQYGDISERGLERDELTTTISTICARQCECLEGIARGADVACFRRFPQKGHSRDPTTMILVSPSLEVPPLDFPLAPYLIDPDVVK